MTGAPAWLAGNVKLILAVVFCVVIVVGLNYTGTSDRERIDALAEETHGSLCAFKAGLRRDLAETERFLDAVTEGRRDRIHGVSDADLQRSINRQRDTLNDLASLECP